METHQITEGEALKRGGERRFITGEIARVLACPDCSSIWVERYYSIDTGALYPNARAKYQCEKGHWFNEPGHGWIKTYDPDLTGKL